MKAARAEAKKWASNGIEIAIKPQLDRANLEKIRQQLSKVVGRAMINPRLDQARMKAVKAQIDKQVGNISVRPKLDQTALKAIRERIDSIAGKATVNTKLDQASLKAIRQRINSSVGNISVRARLDQDSLAALRARLNSISATVTVKVRLDQASLAALRARLRAMSFRSTLSLDVDRDTLDELARRLAQIGPGFDNASQSARNFGDESSGAFSRAHGAARVFIALMPALLPMLGSLVQAAVGLGGALVATFVGAAATLGAFAVVAVPTFKKISDAAKKSREEIALMPPGIRDAAGALKTLQEEYKNLVARTEQNVGTAMAAGFSAATAAIKTLDPLINSMSTSLTHIGQEMTTYFGSAHWQGFVDFMSREMVPVWSSFWDIVKYLTRAVMELSVAFMPMAQWLLSSIATGMQQFAEWASKLAGDPAFHKWVEQAKESLRAFWDFLVAVTQFLFSFANALAPIGVIVMDMLTGVFTALSKMPPEFLAGIAGGLSAIMAALLLGASPQVAIVIGIITGIAFALTTLYQSSERLQAALDPVITTIRDIFQPVFERLSDLFQQRIVPAFTAIGDVIIDKVIPAFNTFLTAAGPFIAFFTETVGTVAIFALETLLDTITFVLEEIASAFRFWAAVFTGDWDTAWQEMQTSFGLKMEFLKGIWADVWVYFGEELTTAGEAIKAGWDSTWEGLSTIFKNATDPIKTGWTDTLTWIEDGIGLKRGSIQAGWEGFWTDMKEYFQPIIDQIAKGWDDLWLGFEDKQTEGSAKTMGSWIVHWAGLYEQFNLAKTVILAGWDEWWTSSNTTQETNQATSQVSWAAWLAGMIVSFAGWRLQLITEALTAWNEFTLGLSNMVVQATAQFESLRLGAVSSVSGMVIEVTGFFQNLQTNAVAAVSGMVVQVLGFFTNLQTQAVGAVSNLVVQVVAGFNNLRTQAVSAVSGAVVQIVGFFTNLQSQVVGAIGGLVVQAVGKFNELRTGALNALSSLPGQMAAIGRSIVQGIIDGVQGMAGSLFGTLANLAANALAAAKGALGIASPSKLFKNEVGAQIGAGLIAGIREMIPSAVAAIDDLTDQLAPSGKITVMPRGQFNVGGLNASAPMSFDGEKSEERLALLLEEIKELLERRGTGATVNMYGVEGSPEENAQAARLALRFT